MKNMFEPCPNKAACLGSRDADHNNESFCDEAAGYANLRNNTRCSSCAPEFALANDGSGRCTRCTGEDGGGGEGGGSAALLGVVVVMAVFLFCMLVGLKMRSTSNRKKADHSTMKRSLLTHLQMISIVMSLHVAWPAPVRDALAFVSSLTNVAGHTAAVQCSMSQENRASNADLFYAALVVSAVMPVASAVVTFIYWFWLAPRNKCLSCGRKLVKSPVCPTRNPFSPTQKKEHAPAVLSAKGVPLHSTRDGWIVTNILLVYILYPSIVKMGFQMLQDERICGEYYWALDNAVDYHGDVHMSWVFGVAVPALLVYGLCTPLLALLYLWKRKDRHTNTKLVFRVGLLYSGYAPRYYWWELVIFCRKVSIILISTFGHSHAQQLHIALGVLVLLLYLQEHARPFNYAAVKEDDDQQHQQHLQRPAASNNRLHFVESGSLLILIAMVWSAVFFDLTTCAASEVFCSKFVGVLGVCVLLSNFCFVIGCAFVVAKAWTERNRAWEKVRQLKMAFSATWGGGGGGGESKGDDSNLDGQEEEPSMTFQETRLQGSLGDVALKSNPLNKKKGKLSVSEMGFSTWRRGDVAEKEKVASEAAAGQKPPTAEMELPSWGGAPKEKGQGWEQNVANRQEVSDGSPIPCDVPGWEMLVDDASGRAYYHNPMSGETSWEKPLVEESDDWVAHVDPTTKQTYYHSHKRSRVTWTEHMQKE